MWIVAFFALMMAQTFEVASVKPAERPPERGIFSGVQLGVRPDGVSLRNADLYSIILIAYDIDLSAAPFGLDISKFKGTDSILGKHFTIEARGQGDVKAMLRNLLEQRFGFQAHTETRVMPMYALRLKQAGKLGEQLKATQMGCAEWLRLPSQDRPPTPPPCQFNPEQFAVLETDFRRGAGKMEELARLAAAYLRQPVVDETGLEGNFEWAVRFARKESSNAARLPEAFEDQLGLQLVRRTGPQEVIVIDEVGMPTEN